MKKVILIAAMALLSGVVFANENTAPNGKTVTHYAVHVHQPSFVPQKVYGDGTFTYIEFGDTAPAELPVFFEVSKDGSKVLRNYVYESKLNRIRVNGTFQRGELRIGDDVVVLYRS